jgi:hypothetical protein
MDPEELLVDALPNDARELIERTETEVEELRQHAEQEADDIRAHADQEAARVQDEAERQVRQRQRRLLEQLQPLQDAYARAGRLDEALAIRDRVRQLSRTLADVRIDPGYLDVGEQEVGRSYLYEVTGSLDGPVWGTDLYTSDSSLSAAAVHAGVLREGERGLVRVTVEGTLNANFTGSERNGVWSEDWEAHPFGYRLSRP